MDDCCANKGHEIGALAAKAGQRRVLQIVLAINAAMFLIEFTGGVIAGSSALMADSVDMLGDALVYTLSLAALSRGVKWEAGAGVAKGVIILGFAMAVAGEVVWKVLDGVPPSSLLMLIFGTLALAANLTCLGLLWRFRTLNINMSSTFECSRNDVISNVSVLVAAGLVAAFDSAWPDIAVGSIIVVLFARSAWRILREAWPQFRAARSGMAR